MTRTLGILGVSLLVAGAIGVGFAATTPGKQPCIKPEKGKGCLPIAPARKRVDIKTPTFSNPTKVTNPLHPTAAVDSVLMLGRVDRLPFRTEVTLLPGTKVIEWKGKKIRTLVSQYAAFLDGRLHEVAIDWYAQADDRAVWYFGEDVFNYDETGKVGDTHGTWLAGKDGPPGMIMPGKPRVGDVYRPENIPGFVFEEVTVKAVGRTVHGPRGPIHGAVVIDELHADGTREDKIFAPGYGEFTTGAGGELEAAALAVPTDALTGPPRAAIRTLTTGATSIFDAAQRNEWQAASATLARMVAAWGVYQRDRAPRMLESQMSAGLVYLVAAVDAHQSAESRQAAIDVARAGLDFELRHRPVTKVDLDRFGLWVRQAQVDATAREQGALTGDVATLEWVFDRFAHTLDGSAKRIDIQLQTLRKATRAGSFARAQSATARLRTILAELN
jgi:hypothetical protein